MREAMINKPSLFFAGILCFLFIHVQHVHSSDLYGGYQPSRNYIYPGNNPVVTGNNNDYFGRKVTDFERKFEATDERHEKLGKRFDKFEREFNGFKSKNIFQMERSMNTLMQKATIVETKDQKYQLDLKRYNDRISVLEYNLGVLTRQIESLTRTGSGDSCCAEHSRTIQQIQQTVAVASSKIQNNQYKINDQDRKIAENRNDLNKFKNLDANAVQNLVQQVQNNSYMHQQQVLRYNSVFQGLTNVSRNVLENSRKIQDLSGSSGNLREIGDKLKSLDKNVLENLAKIEKNSKNARTNELKSEECSRRIQELSSKDEEKSEKLKDHSKKIDGLIASVRENSGKIRENEENVAENSKKILSVLGEVQENSRKVLDLYEKMEKGAGDSGLVKEIAKKFQELSKTVNENSKFVRENSKQIGENSKNIQETIEKSIENLNKIQENLEKIELNNKKIHKHSTEMKNVLDNQKETSGKVAANSQKIDQNSRKADENTKNNQENLKKIVDNNERLKANAENILNSNKAIQQNLNKIGENSAEIRKNSEKIQEANSKIGTNSKKLDGISQNVQDNSEKIYGNSLEIKGNQEKLEKDAQNLKNVSETFEEYLKKERIANDQRITNERLVKERMEKEHIEKERKEIERKENERKEKERIENERKEKERIENERKEKERIENERKEKERIEKERKEKKRIEKERIENERKEIERKEKERIETERKEKERIENERIENERKEKERIENERKEKERIEKERIENERKEKERLIEEKRRVIEDIKRKVKEEQSKPPSKSPPNISPTTKWDPELTKEVQPLALKWTIPKISDKLKDPSMNLESAYFKLPGYPMEAKAKLFFKPSTTDIHVALSFKDPGKPLSHYYPFPQISYILKDQRGGVEARDRATSYSLALNSDELAFNEDVLEEFLLFKPRLLSSHSHFIKDDSIVLEVHVETPSMARLSQTQNGTLVSQVDHFEERRKLAGKYLVGWTSSPYFYTHPNGYRVQLQLWLSLGKQIAPFINFLTTDHDKDLATSFPHKTTLTIFNPKDFTNNLVLSKETDLSDESQYDLSHINYDEIKNYVVNDNLYYQLDIQPL